MLRTTVTAALSALLVTTGATVAAQASAPAHDRTSAAEARRVDRVKVDLAWTPCFEIAECSTAEVPLDYDQPDGPRTEIAVLRVKAKDPARRIGSLFVNPGGPGGSSTELALDAAGLDSELRDRFDIVGVDPRGIGMSANVRCFTSAAAQQEALSPLQLAFPYGRAEERAYVRASERLGRACSTTGRPLTGAMSTAEVARDMDVIRRAVGDRELTFLGFSYGSALGQYYANMFPDRVRAIAVDGVLDPIAWTGAEEPGKVLEERLRSSAGAGAAFREALKRCDAVGEQRCAFAAGDPFAEFDKIVRQLQRKPLELPTPDGTFTVTYADLIGSILGNLYGELGGDYATVILAEVRAALDPAGPAARERLAARITGARAAVAADDEPYDNSPDTSAVLCTDVRVPDDASDWVAAAARADRRVPHFGRLWGWVAAQCATDTWTVRDEDAYRGPFDRRTKAPLLFVGNFWDPATAYHGAVSASARQPGSRLLSSDNWGHTAYLTSVCATAAVDAYLLSGALPARGTVCTDGRQPFDDQVPTGRRSAPAKQLPIATPRPPSILDGTR